MTAEQLRDGVALAFKTKDTKTLMSLYNWDEVQEKVFVEKFMKKAFEERWKSSHEVIRVELSPLPARYKATNETFGLRTRDNVNTVGMIDIKCSDKAFDDHLPYGTKNGFFYIAQTVRETIPGKNLRVTVSIFDPHPFISYTGACEYVKEGKQVGFELCGTNKYIEENLWGDYIKSCFVQKTCAGGLIMLEITEDHKKVFRSPQIKTEEIISYERKK